MTELERALDEFVPTKIARTKDRVPWVTNKLKKQLRKQKKLFEKQKGSSKFSRASQHYKAYKGFVQRQTRQAYWSYINNIISPNENEGVQESNKRFWRFIKHKKQDTQGVAPLKSNGKLENNSKKKATILNDQFKSVFSEPSPLSLEQLSKQAMNDASPKVPQMNFVEIMEYKVPETFSWA